MRHSKSLLAGLCAVCLTVSSVPVMADKVTNESDGMGASSGNVVTLGSDLSDEQKRLVMQYFGTSSAESNIIYITHDDEVSYLSEYVPMEKIGSRTLSCAYVRPTTEGGIKVKTANLTYVTPNMIASSLSTSGIKNCEVIAACPIEVSGTGALTGVLMAYERAVGKGLDEGRKDLATQEMVVTSELAEQIGTDEASKIINDSKQEVLEGNVQNADEIKNIVNNIIIENGLDVSQEEFDKIISLLEKIASQGIDYDEVKDALDSIEDSLNNKDGEETDVPEDSGNGDSILDGTDDSVLDGDADSSEDLGEVEDDTSKLEVVNVFLSDWSRVVSGECTVDDLGLDNMSTEYNLLSGSTIVLDTERANKVAECIKSSYSDIVNGIDNITLEDVDRVYESDNLNKIIKDLNTKFTIDENSPLNGILSIDEANSIVGMFKSYFNYIYTDSNASTESWEVVE